MTAAIRSFGTGVTESSGALIDHFVTISAGTAIAGGVGFLMGGTPLAWLAAKIAAMVMGMINAMGQAPVSLHPDHLLSAENGRSIGRMTTSIGIPPLLVYAVQLFVG
jgi:fructose/tagatose bisphosphate aldolase